MAPLPHRFMARTVYSTTIEAPIYAAIVPVTVFLVLGACACLRGMARRREASLGPTALERGLWSWLAICVGNRPLLRPRVVYPNATAGDGWESASSPLPPHMSVASCSEAAASRGSPASSKRSMLVLQNPKRQRRPTQMWEYVGRMDADYNDDGDVGRQSKTWVTDRTTTHDYGDEPVPNQSRSPDQPLPGGASLTPSSLSPLTPNGLRPLTPNIPSPKAKLSESGRTKSLPRPPRIGSLDSSTNDGIGSPTARRDGKHDKRKGVLLTQPPLLHLSPGNGGVSSHWGGLGTARSQDRRQDAGGPHQSTDGTAASIRSLTL